MRFHAPAFTFCIATVAASSVLGQGWQRLPSRTPSPSDNPTTTAKVELGKKLFFDPRISLTGTVSCNSRHNLVEGGDDGRPTSMGIHGLVGPRNAPTVWNAAFQASQFWDGRSPSLEDQAKGPIVAAPEMGIPNHDHAIRRIAAIPGYQNEFREVFGGGDIGKYQLTKDLGRAAVTGDEPNRHHFKVPTLRNITLTAPYFHNGLVTTLGQAVRVMAETQLDEELSSSQVDDVTAFLGALEGEFPRITLPRLPSKPGETVIKAAKETTVSTAVDG